jgi:hypothetical protein
LIEENVFSKVNEPENTFGLNNFPKNQLRYTNNSFTDNFSQQELHRILG